MEPIRVEPLRRIPDARGCVMHGWKAEGHDCDVRVQEVYATTIRRGVVKGWHKHKSLTVRYVPLVGEVRIVLLDARECGDKRDFVMGARNYVRVTIPPGVWIACQALTEEAMLLNVADEMHVPSEMERRNPRDVLRLPCGCEYRVDWHRVDD